MIKTALRGIHRNAAELFFLQNKNSLLTKPAFYAIIITQGLRYTVRVNMTTVRRPFSGCMLGEVGVFDRQKNNKGDLHHEK
jgi:hypothetical protein